MSAWTQQMSRGMERVTIEALRPMGSASAADAPVVTIVTPCFNAEATLGRTIESVRAQTHDRWELLLVDDGSTDGTLRLARAAAAQDPRIRVFQDRQRGPAAARNVGIAAARGEWLLFLDSDDWLAKSALADLLGAARSSPAAKVIVGGIVRVDGRGAFWPSPRHDLSDPFSLLSHHCALLIHSALVRRDVVVEVGGFDEGLRTSEDWDLWQKIARTGAAFGQADPVVGFYQARVGSMSRDLRRFAADALVVMQRGHAPDPRVPRPFPAYAGGDDPTALPFRRMLYVLWAAARDVAAGGDGLETLRLGGPPPDHDFDPDVLGPSLASGMADMLAVQPSALAPRWPEFEPKLRALLGAAAPPDALTRSTDLTLGVMKARFGAGAAGEPDVVEISGNAPPPWGVLFGPLVVRQLWARPGAVGGGAVPLLGQPSPRTLAEAAIQQSRRFSLAATLRALRPWTAFAFSKSLLATVGDPRGLGSRSWLKGRVRPAAMVRHRVREGVARGVEATVRGRLHHWLASTQPDAHRAALSSLMAEFAVPEGRDPRAVGGRVGGAPAANRKATAWDDPFGANDPWNHETSEYELLKHADTLELVPDLPDGEALELACAEGHFTRRLAPKVGRLLATDVSPVAVAKARQRCEGQDNIRFATLDFAKGALPGGPYDLIVCSEVLYRLGPHLEEIARKIDGALKPGGLLVTAHAHQVEDDPGSTGFDRGHAVGPRRIEEAFSRAPGLSLERETRRPLYRVQAWRKAQAGAAAAPIREERPLEVTLEPSVARDVVWGGGESRLWALKRMLTTSVPVLTYHRVAAEGAATLDRYRVTPEAFEAQMAWLRRRGYWGVTPGRLHDALRTNRPLPGRPVMITFDDGYQDFVDHAWPALRVHDFPATVFVVAGKVGRRANWDADHGEPGRLMDWATLSRLSDEGCAIESHGLLHNRLTRLPSEALYRELLSSRAEIARATGRPPTALCYPYGAHDRFVAHAAAECGYLLGFSSNNGPVTLAADPMRLRRIEITGADDLVTFAGKLASAVAAFA